MRRVPWDGGLLFFDRDSGWNVLVESEHTRDLRMAAPRAVQLAITNGCNLACTFCSRDTRTPSTWTVSSALTLLRDLADAGVLEVALGGGEPFAFRGLDELVERVYDETPLAIGLTTNGVLCDERRLSRLAPKLSQVRLSLYDDNDWRATVDRFVASGVRWGVNWLLVPARLPFLEQTVLELVERGCRDVLLLSYKGEDARLHLDAVQVRDAARRIRALARAVAGRCALKLDICWGERMEEVPQLFSEERRDCGAGRDFVVITSDRRVAACSFHHASIPFGTASELLAIWRARREALGSAARKPGCTRSQGAGAVTLAMVS